MRDRLLVFLWRTWPFEWMLRGVIWLVAPHGTPYCGTCPFGIWLDNYECPDGKIGGHGCRVYPREWTKDSFILWDDCKECGVSTWPDIDEQSRT
jgi:hypothetical protein